MSPSKSIIKFCVTGQSPDIMLSVRMDDQIRWQGSGDLDPVWVSVDFCDDEGSHRLQWILSGKTVDHTKINHDGKITSDCVVTIKEVTVDGICIDPLIWQSAWYEHDFNGTREATKTPFYGVMGCNGTATLEFTTPVYLWLLENM